jgi:hypothetical protein
MLDGGSIQIRDPCRRTPGGFIVAAQPAYGQAGWATFGLKSQYGADWGTMVVARRSVDLHSIGATVHEDLPATSGSRGGGALPEIVRAPSAGLDPEGEAVLTDQFQAAAAAARNTHAVDEIARLTWRAHAEGQLQDAEAHAVSEALQARRATFATRPHRISIKACPWPSLFC